MKKIFYGLFILSLSLVLVACTTNDGGNKVVSVEITGPSEVIVGNQITLEVTVDPSDATVTWTSSKTDVATVSNGVVSGLKAGTTVIKASAGDKSDEVTITVKEAAVVEEGVTPNTEEHTVSDSRVNGYIAYDANGDEVSTFKSLYTAIEYVVNNESYDAYVTKASGPDSDFKLFTYNEKFASDSDDMFYFYSKGNQLDTYTSWKDTYFQDLKNIGDAIAIQVSSTFGASQYFNSHKLVGVSSTNETANNTQYWNVTPQIESSATVNMIAYSGITKQEYDVALTQSKIYPSMNQDQTTSARIGFIVTDAYNTSNMGLQMDPKTGNWYYYSGETPWDWNGTDLDVDTDVTLMTSTWHEEGYFVPDEDVNFTTEILAITDEDGGFYMVDRVTMEFVQSGRIVVRDYEYSQLTQAGTIRFTTALDINSNGELPDYMNGSKFENIVVTRAVAHALEEMQNVVNYGIIAELDAGVYDILNSNPESAARFQTILYTPAIVSADFSTPGKDVYNFSYALNADNPALSDHIQAVIDLIAALPSVEAITLEDKALVVAARTAYNALSDYRNPFVTNLDVLETAEMRLNELVLGADELEAVAAGLLVKELSGYGDLDALNAASAHILDAFAKFDILSDESKASVVQTLGSNKVVEVYEFYTDANALEDAELIAIVNYAMWIKDYTFDGSVASLAEFADFYSNLTEADILTLPEATQVIINDPTKIQAFSKQFGIYMTTYEFILDVMDTYGVDLEVKVTVGEGDEQGEIVDTTAVDHEAIAAEFAEVAGLWQEGVVNESWNFRVNYAGRFDFVVEGGFEKYYPVLYSLLYNSELYGYNWGTGLIDIL